MIYNSQNLSEGSNESATRFTLSIRERYNQHAEDMLERYLSGIINTAMSMSNPALGDIGSSTCPATFTMKQDSSTHDSGTGHNTQSISQSSWSRTITKHSKQSMLRKSQDHSYAAENSFEYQQNVNQFISMGQESMLEDGKKSMHKSIQSDDKDIESMDTWDRPKTVECYD